MADYYATYIETDEFDIWLLWYGCVVHCNWLLVVLLAGLSVMVPCRLKATAACGVPRSLSSVCILFGGVYWMEPEAVNVDFLSLWIGPVTTAGSVMVCWELAGIVAFGIVVA